MGVSKLNMKPCQNKCVDCLQAGSRCNKGAHARAQSPHTYIYIHTHRDTPTKKALRHSFPPALPQVVPPKPQALQEHKVGFNAEARNVPCTSKAQRVFSPDPPLDRKSQVQKSLRIPGCEWVIAKSLASRVGMYCRPPISPAHFNWMAI